MEDKDRQIRIPTDENERLNNDSTNSSMPPSSDTSGKPANHYNGRVSIPWLQSHSIRYREPSIPNDRAT